MAKLTLVTGGSRSGKSRYAQARAETSPAPRLYVATMPLIDEEMGERIARHRDGRAGRGWETAEEQCDLAGVLTVSGGFPVRLVDCVTAWVSNLMYHAESAGRAVTEEEIAERCGQVIAACRTLPGEVIFVTNEVGMGLVPDNPVGRRFRDLAGRANQTLAEAADEVVLLVSGCPLTVKG
jgi:adenosylcobinamide kinase/adenosylcobinamide-phosphate guanylyltransferase